MRVVLFALVMVGCGNMSQGVAGDLGPDLAPAPDLLEPDGPPPPAGFGTTCQASTDCKGFTADRAPGFLGCGAYLGAAYCTLPCGASANGAGCWKGSSCECVERTNAGGFPETDCYCAK